MFYAARRRGSRFLAVDPVEGGSCNDYDYVCADPVNKFDLSGTVVTGAAYGRTMFVYWVLRWGGLSKTTAAALVGNFIYESGYTMDPNKKQVGGSAVGIAQWDDRKTLLKNTLGNNWNTLAGQSLFVLYELNTTETRARDKINECGTNLMCATVAARVYYERPNPEKANDAARIEAAAWVADQWWAF